MRPPLQSFEVEKISIQRTQSQIAKNALGIGRRNRILCRLKGWHAVAFVLTIT